MEQSFTACVPMTNQTSTFELGRTCWLSSNPYCIQVSINFNLWFLHYYSPTLTHNLCC